MTWKIEMVKPVLKVKFTEYNAGNPFLVSEEHILDGFPADISSYLSIDRDYSGIEVHNMEVFKHPVKKDYKNGVINDLFVGVLDGENIAYVGNIWVPKKAFNGKRVNQFFFSDDEPSEFDYGHASGSGWPTNRPPVLDKRLIRCFHKLKKVVPCVSDSLDNCVKHLTKAGPDYKGSARGIISFVSEM